MIYFNKTRKIAKCYLIWVLLIGLVPCFCFADDAMNVSPVVTQSNDGVIDVVNHIEYEGIISAIAIKVNLPDQVEFISVSSDSQPAIKPATGDTGLLEFAWVMPPSSPFTFKYSVQSENDVTGQIDSTIIYRKDAGQLVKQIKPIQINP